LDPLLVDELEVERRDVHAFKESLPFANAVIALRSTNLRAVDMAPGADDNQALPVPAAG